MGGARQRRCRRPACRSPPHRPGGGAASIARGEPASSPLSTSGSAAAGRRLGGGPARPIGEEVARGPLTNVEVQHRDPRALVQQGDRKVGGDGRLAGAAFLVADDDDSRAEPSHPPRSRPNPWPAARPADCDTPRDDARRSRASGGVDASAFNQRGSRDRTRARRGSAPHGGDRRERLRRIGLRRPWSRRLSERRRRAA